jgi:tRNA_anti-like
MNGYQQYEILKKINFIISFKLEFKIKGEYMALVPCPECKKEISDISKSCPNCGFPMSEYTRNQLNSSTPPPLPPPLPKEYLDSKKSLGQMSKLTKQDNYSKKVFWGSLSIIIIFICIITFGKENIPTESGKETQTKAEPVSESTTANVEPKINYLKTTATKMINTYNSNEVRADNIYKDTYIEVTGIVGSIDSDLSNEAVINLASKNEYEFNSVIASGDLDFQKKATNINKGQIITLRCIGGGEVVGNPILNQCTFK